MQSVLHQIHSDEVNYQPQREVFFTYWAQVLSSRREHMRIENVHTILHASQCDSFALEKALHSETRSDASRYRNNFQSVLLRGRKFGDSDYCAKVGEECARRG